MDAQRGKGAKDLYILSKKSNGSMLPTSIIIGKFRFKVCYVDDVRLVLDSCNYTWRAAK